MREELLKGLTEEQIVKVKECKNHEELLALAKQEGIELTDEQLAAVSGGGCFSSRKCPDCGSHEYEKIVLREGRDASGDRAIYKCKKCGRKWS